LYAEGKKKKSISEKQTIKEYLSVPGEGVGRGGWREDS
jgi:hypothetical protein